ncbi:DUF6878 family protein [Ralstonia soli]|uniref:DUF6878 domain-containing protein n=1 Tax=Ralstonia soli TaxID=2953896 RepID=A0ABT1ANF1_9RALS|nr:DUF6878 family protein [Ralstonia soli]MCO5399744.1 hypothetical protein [Ralstonia soli]
MSNTQADPVLSHNRAVLLDALRTAGATSAVISYSGYGDSGNANEIQILDAEGQEVNGDHAVSIMREDRHYADGQWQSTYAMVEMSLHDALDGFADRAVGRYHPGYWNGEGGEGDITFDCASDAVRVAHRDFYTEQVATDTDL